MASDGGVYKHVKMHIAETETANGTAAECVVVGIGGFTTLSMHVEGINGETITFEATIDGTNWIAIMVENLTTGTEATTATADGLYRVVVLGLLQVRARISTGGTGTVYVDGLLVA